MGTTITEESTRFKKNPIQATLGLFGVSAASITAGYKAAMHAREHGEGLDKFLAIFQTIWYKFLAKLTRTNLTSEGDENTSVDSKPENE